LLWRGNADREASLHTQRSIKKTSGMNNDKCERCGNGLIEIDHWSERLTGCPNCNRWQASTGEWCRLAPDDIVALRALKTDRAKKTAPEVESPEPVFSPPVSPLYAARVSSRVATDVINSDSQYGIPAI